MKHISIVNIENDLPILSVLNKLSIDNRKPNKNRTKNVIIDVELRDPKRRMRDMSNNAAAKNFSFNLLL